MKQIKKFLAITAVMATLTIGGLAAITASADPVSAHGANTNGCSYVPDSGWFFDFHSSCDTHDLCYTYKWYGNSSSGRKACDQRFYNDMKRSCDGERWYARGACRSLAWTYYTGVRWFGGSAFNSATPANVRVG